MKMVVGLGNPGQEYRNTRHNVGFMVLDELARRWDNVGWRNKHEALITEQRDKAVLLVKPQTYMNLSGAAVGAVARWYKIAPIDIIVIYDDMDLAIGRLRLRSKGSSGGHKGIESILINVGVEDFTRVRVGIGHPDGQRKVISHVLTKFSIEEEQIMVETLRTAVSAVEFILDNGLDKAMNKYNS